MREIKFRGKDVESGARVYGDLIINNAENYFIHIRDKKGQQVRMVYSDTVGQFTGLHDKKGKEIYEGDIVVIEDIIKGYVRSNARYWRYEVAAADEPLENERIPSGRPEECWMVIGNIHDNPELLKTK